MDSPPLFLTEEDVLEFHRSQIAEFGGVFGVGDHGLLQSALAAPENDYLYDDQARLVDFAAAYAFHIVKNHPFADGNKRTALQTCIAFLKVNGVGIDTSPEKLYEMTVALAGGSVSEQAFAEMLNKHRASVRGVRAFVRRFF